MLIDEIDPLMLPMEVLLLADPSETAIKKYLIQSRCFKASIEGRFTAVCLVRKAAEYAWEVMNIAVLPSDQQNGIGTRLLQHVIQVLKSEGTKSVEVGTGSFGYQLIFYQRLGFRVESVDKGFFERNYTEPLVENGIQHKDMLRLKLEL